VEWYQAVRVTKYLIFFHLFGSWAFVLSPDSSVSTWNYLEVSSATRSHFHHFVMPIRSDLPAVKCVVLVLEGRGMSVQIFARNRLLWRFHGFCLFRPHVGISQVGSRWLASTCFPLLYCLIILSLDSVLFVLLVGLYSSIVQWVCSLFQTMCGERGIVLCLFNLNFFLYNLTHGLLTWYGLFSLLSIQCSVLFCDIVLLFVTVFLLCIVLCLLVITCCYPNWGFSVLFSQL
jgi:hypothetical protein